MKIRDYISSRLNQVRTSKAKEVLSNLVAYANVMPVVYWNDLDEDKPVLYVSNYLVKLYTNNERKDEISDTDDIIHYVKHVYEGTVQLFIKSETSKDNDTHFTKESYEDSLPKNFLKIGSPYKHKQDRGKLENVSFKRKYPKLHKELRSFNLQNLIDHALDTKNFELLKELGQ